MIFQQRAFQYRSKHLAMIADFRIADDRIRPMRLFDLAPKMYWHDDVSLPILTPISIYAKQGRSSLTVQHVLLIDASAHGGFTSAMHAHMPMHFPVTITAA
jgi:hypothetical protein